MPCSTGSTSRKGPAQPALYSGEQIGLSQKVKRHSALPKHALGRRPIIVIDTAMLRPRPFGVVGVFRCLLKLIQGNGEPVASDALVVFERSPGQRIMFSADPKEAAEAEDGIGDASADLLDHHAFD